MAALSGGLWSRVSVGALLALWGLAVLQTVPVRRSEKTVTDSIAVVFNANTAPFLTPERLQWNRPGPNPENDLVLSNFRLAEQVQGRVPGRTAWLTKRFSGDIINDSPFLYAGDCTLHFQDKNDHEVGAVTFSLGSLRPHETLPLTCEAPPATVTG